MSCGWEGNRRSAVHCLSTYTDSTPKWGRSSTPPIAYTLFMGKVLYSLLIYNMFMQQVSRAVLFQRAIQLLTQLLFYHRMTFLFLSVDDDHTYTSNSNSNSNLLKQQRAKSHLQDAKTMIKHAIYAYYIYYTCSAKRLKPWIHHIKLTAPNVSK